MDQRTDQHQLDIKEAPWSLTPHQLSVARRYLRICRATLAGQRRRNPGLSDRKRPGP